MKRLNLWLMVLVVVLSGTTARADFYVITGGGAPGTKITSVPYTISSPGFYYLGGNLTYNGDGNAITVNADDVTIDLMEFSLINGGAMGYTRGIYMDGRSNVEIRNGAVGGFEYGVYEKSLSGNHHRALNVRATGNYYGIVFQGSNHLIKSCNGSNNNDTGLFLVSGLITDCVASSNYCGIRFLGPGDVLGNAAFNNSEFNFRLGFFEATAILVDGNSSYGLTTNYFVCVGTTGIEWGTNAGTP